jgi:hypothetical protein
MNTLRDNAIFVMLIPLSAIAVLAVISPRTLIRYMGGPTNQRRAMPETFLRVAETLVLVGAAWKFHEWLRFR